MTIITNRAKLLAGFFILFSIILHGQRNDFPVDSFLKLLPGSWTGMAIECKNQRSDSTVLRIEFLRNQFTMTRIKNGKALSKDSGTFTMDTARTGGYRMTVLLDKPYPQHPYNALRLNLDVFESDKIRMSLFECVYHKGELHTRHYPGDFRLYKDSSAEIQEGK